VGNCGAEDVICLTCGGSSAHSHYRDSRGRFEPAEESVVPL
jgi:hypothetical protein